MKILLLYWGIMLSAYFSASKLRRRLGGIKFIPHITMGIVYVIILLMGLRMGANREVIGSIGSIGISAVFITVACVAGSMVSVFALRRFFGMDRYGNIVKDTSKVHGTEYRGESRARDCTRHDIRRLMSSLVIFALFAGGIVVGIVFIQKQPYAAGFDSFAGAAMKVLLYVMVGFVGFDLGLSGEVVKSLRTIGFRAFLFPIAAIVGTLICGTAAGCIAGFSVRESMAICAGFGWYTYAPAVIASAGARYAVASAVSFLYNMLRETASGVLIPVFAQRFGYLEVTAMPGIAAMDSCMPIIENSCRSDTVVYAFLTGFMMNIVTSVGVPLIIGA